MEETPEASLYNSCLHWGWRNVTLANKLESSAAPLQLSLNQLIYYFATFA